MNRFHAKHNNARHLWLAMLLGLLGMLTLGMLGGCKNDGALSADTGEVIIGLTDAPGDFLKYSVGVKSLKLTRADGAVVSVLPNSATVDFTQYTDMTEFFTAATVPSGRYVKATVTLDYTSAVIQVEKNGVATDAVARDRSGNAITTLDVDVTLSNANSLVIAPGVPAHLALDFDLASSNSVDLIPATPVVTVNPTLVADVELNDSRQHLVRGLLGSVDTSAATFQLTLRPLFAATGSFGGVTIFTDNNTNFEIDGQSYTGSSGLNALALETANSWVLVLGHFNTTTRRFEATEVHAGSSVAVNGQDVVTGVVLKRVGDVVTVNAGSIVRSNGSLVFNKDITATLTGAAVYSRQLSANTFSKNDVSVGQRVSLVGTLTDTAGNLAMDNPVHVRMLLTQISGIVSVVSDGRFFINLQHIMGRPASRFDFSGTGPTRPDDAVATNYDVKTASLSIGSLTVGAPVKVRGFVPAFGNGGTWMNGNFIATSFIEASAVPATMVVGFLPAQLNALTASATQISLDMTKTGLAPLHHVWRLGVATDMAGTTPMIKPNTAGTGLFVINYNGTITVYSSFGDFVNALNTFPGGAKVRQASAWGSYSDGTTTLTANAVGVLLN